MAANLELALRIKALVEGKPSVDALTGGMRDLNKVASVPIPDNTAKFRAGLDQTAATAGHTTELLDSLKSQLLGLAGVVGGAALVKSVIDQADAYSLLSARLKVAVGEHGDYEQALKDTFAISQQTSTPLEATAALYAKLARAQEELNITQRQTADLTEIIGKAFKVSGATTAEQASATLQLSQALGSGVLRGEEFNSIMEQGGRIAQALADGLHVPIGALKQLAAEGQLTSSIVVKALLEQKDAIDKEFAALPLTVDASLTQVKNALSQAFGELNQQTGVTQGLASALTTIADNANILAAAVGATLVTGLLKAGTATLTWANNARIASQATRDQAIASAQAAAATEAEAAASVAAAEAVANKTAADLAAARAAVARVEAERTQLILAGQLARTDTLLAQADLNLAAARARSAVAAQASVVALKNLSTASIAAEAGMAAATTGAGLFSRALAFLSGPTGLILTAVASLGAFIFAMRNTGEEAGKSEDAIRRFAESLKAFDTGALQDQLDRQNAVIELTKNNLAEYKNKLIDLEQAQKSYGGRIGVSTVSEAKLSDVRSKLADQTALLAFQQEKAAKLAAELAARQVEESNAGGKLAITLQKQVEGLGNYEKQLDAVNKAQLGQIEAQGRLARALNDEAGAAEAASKAAQARAAAAAQSAQIAEEEAALANARVQAFKDLEKVQGRLNDLQATGLQAAQQAAEKATTEAAARQALAAALAAEAANLDPLIAARKREADTAQQALDFAKLRERTLKAESEANIGVLETLRDLATARGQDFEAGQLQIKINKERIRQSEQQILQLGKEIELNHALSAAKIAEALASGDKQKIKEALAIGEVIKQLDAELAKRLALLDLQKAQTNAAPGSIESVKKATAQTEAGIKALEDEINARKGVTSATQGQAGAQDKVTKAFTETTFAATEFQHAAELSQGPVKLLGGVLEEVAQKAEAAGRSQRDSAASSSAALDRLNRGYEALKQNLELIQRFGRGADAAANPELFERIRLIEDYRDRLTEVVNLTDQLTKATANGTLTAGQLAQATNAAASASQVLADEDLAQFRSAIEDARRKMQAMEDATKSAKDRVAELDAQIAAAQGDKERADALRRDLKLQQDLREIEAQRAKAQAEGNRELLQLLDEQARKVKTLADLDEANAKRQARQAQNRTEPDAGESNVRTFSRPSGGQGGGLDTRALAKAFADEIRGNLNLQLDGDILTRNVMARAAVINSRRR